MWRIGLLLYLVAGSRQLSFKEFSVPKAVESGEDVSLHCIYKLDDKESDAALYVKWWWTPLNGSSDEKSQLYQRITGHPPDIMDSRIKIEGGDNILIANITPEYSGTYECEVSNIDEIRQHQDLVVYTKGSGPELNITKVEDGPDADDVEDILVTCEAKDVAPYPDLIITLNGEVLSTEETVTDPEWGLYDINATARVSAADMYDAHVSCELSYTDATVSHPQYIDTETFYAGQTEMSTTEDPDDTSTPDATSLTVENNSGSKDQLVAYFFLVLSAFAFHVII